MNADLNVAANTVGNIGAQLFVIFNPNTMHILKKADRHTSLIGKNEGALKRSLTVAIKNKRAKEGQYVIDTMENFNAMDTMVEVKNLLSGKPCMIRKSDLGTCVDPSTERYHSM